MTCATLEVMVASAPSSWQRPEQARAADLARPPRPLDFGTLTSTTYLVCAKSALAIARAVADRLVADLER